MKRSWRKPLQTVTLIWLYERSIGSRNSKHVRQEKLPPCPLEVTRGFGKSARILAYANSAASCVVEYLEAFIKGISVRPESLCSRDRESLPVHVL